MVIFRIIDIEGPSNIYHLQSSSFVLAQQKYLFVVKYWIFYFNFQGYIVRSKIHFWPIRYEIIESYVVNYMNL